MISKVAGPGKWARKNNVLVAKPECAVEAGAMDGRGGRTRAVTRGAWP